ncbi:MAG TPA: hypothetical protein VMM35_12775, partial [Longimicrobiales bacterium]|nr:hypothetical protein [Longimicrobiales bacterium]
MLPRELTAEPVIQELEDPRQRAYLMAFVISGGQVGFAASAAGISRWTVQRWRSGYNGRPPDPDYLRALEVAEELAGQVIEDVAIERATQGLRSFKFNTKTGEPLKHPTRCECGHAVGAHERPRLVKTGAEEGEEITFRKCLECACEDFIGEPYFEDLMDGKLMQFLLRGAKPAKYAERLHIR